MKTNTPKPKPYATAAARLARLRNRLCHSGAFPAAPDCEPMQSTQRALLNASRNLHCLTTLRPAPFKLASLRGGRVA